MQDPARSAVRALAGAGTEQVGRFRFDVDTGSWWWSRAVYAIHGFEPGQVVPTTALMMAHQHPADRAAAVELITAAVTAGKPFCSRHRIVDAAQRVHTVVTLGQGVTDPRGRLVAVTGYLIDVSEPLRRDLAEATASAVARSAEARARIEQAKGALMITYGLDEVEAFALLRWYSQNSNTKLRDIAAGIADHANDPDIAGLAPADRIGEILAGIVDVDVQSPTARPHLGAAPPERSDQSLTA